MQRPSGIILKYFRQVSKLASALIREDYRAEKVRSSWKLFQLTINLITKRSGTFTSYYRLNDVRGTGLLVNATLVRMRKRNVFGGLFPTTRPEPPKLLKTYKGGILTGFFFWEQLAGNYDRHS